jgi:hypothetical protein
MNTARQALGILQRTVQIDIKNARAAQRDLQVRIDTLESDASRIEQMIHTLSAEDQDAIKNGK